MNNDNDSIPLILLLVAIGGGGGGGNLGGKGVESVCEVGKEGFKLHWLPVEYRIQYKIGLLTFKAIHFKTPQYLSNLLSIKGNNRYSLRSASNGLILEALTCRPVQSHIR